MTDWQRDMPRAKRPESVERANAEHEQRERDRIEAAELSADRRRMRSDTEPR